MKNLLYRCLILLLGFCLLAGSFDPVKGQSAEFPGGAIDQYVETERVAARIPGAALAVVRSDGSVYVKGYGSADPNGTPVTPQTPFFLGSVSKSFTALALMQLVEAGKIDLDAPVQRYLPWFTLADANAAAQITIRQLLNHTSGISTGAGELAMLTQQSANMEELIRKQRGLALSAEVGETFQYSNLNYIILGAVIEAASGQAYGDYLQLHIFDPLEMIHSYTTPNSDTATGYQYFFGFPVPTNPPFRADNLPAGYIVSSAEDMAHYLSMWMQDGRYKEAVLLSPQGMQTIRQPAAQVTRYSHYGMGWFTNPDSSVIWHNGATLNFRATMKILREDSLGVVVLYNATDDAMRALFGGGCLISEGVISILYGERPPVSSIFNNGQAYFLLDAILLMLAGLVVWDLLRLRRWQERLCHSRGQIAWAIGSAVIFNWAVPLLLLLGLPAVVAWPVVLIGLPDIGFTVLGMALLLLLSGLVKAALMLRHLRLSRQAAMH